MIPLPLGLVMRITELLGDIARMKPGFEIYETAKHLTIDLLNEMKRISLIQDENSTKTGK